MKKLNEDDEKRKEVVVDLPTPINDPEATATFDLETAAAHKVLVALAELVMELSHKIEDLDALVTNTSQAFTCVLSPSEAATMLGRDHRVVGKVATRMGLKRNKRMYDPKSGRYSVAAFEAIRSALEDAA